jgi:hypothetical protein
MLSLSAIPLAALVSAVYHHVAPIEQEDDIRSFFARFVAAQNAHDTGALRNHLIDSPDFMWIRQGAAVWGRDAAMKRFELLFRGTWQIDMRMNEMKVVWLSESVAEIHAPTYFTQALPGEPPETSKVLMHQVVVRCTDGWKIASIVPIPAK